MVTYTSSPVPANKQEALDFAAKVAEFQKALGMTDLQLAVLLDSSPVQVWRWKSAKSTPPTVRKREDVLRHLERAVARKKANRKRPPA